MRGVKGSRLTDDSSAYVKAFRSRTQKSVNIIVSAFTAGEPDTDRKQRPVVSLFHSFHMKMSTFYVSVHFMLHWFHLSHVIRNVSTVSGANINLYIVRTGHLLKH